MKSLKQVRITFASMILALIFSIMWVSCAWSADPSPSPLPLIVEPVHVLSAWEFFKVHKAEIGGALMTLLFFTSEYIGQNPNIAANNVYQLVRNFLKAKSGQA